MTPTSGLLPTDQGGSTDTGEVSITDVLGNFSGRYRYATEWSVCTG